MHHLPPTAQKMPTTISLPSLMLSIDLDCRRKSEIRISTVVSLPFDASTRADQAVTDEDTIVKFQTIVREGKEIVVGRIKVPTVCRVSLESGSSLMSKPGAHSHAFMLRRYDTNAISLSTMYKVAFPGATEEDERREMDWVRHPEINSTDARSNPRMISETPMAEGVATQCDLQGNGMVLYGPNG